LTRFVGAPRSCRCTRRGATAEMGDLTDDEWNVVNALRRGDLEPLRALLVDGQREIHFEIRRLLAQLIDGQHWMDDFKLELVAKNGRTPAEQVSWARSFKLFAQANATAETMLKHGALDGGGAWEVALTATMQETGLSRATVARHWALAKRR